MSAGPMRTSALARFGVLAVAWTMGLALVASTGQGYLAADARASLLADAQVRIVLGALAARLGPERGVPGSAELESLLAESTEQGLRYLAFVDAEGRVRSAAGVAAGSGRALPAPGQRQRVGGRLRLLAPPPAALGPPPHPPGAPPPPGLGPHPPPLGPGADGPPRLVLEIEPVLARDLVADARHNLIIASVTALLLGLVAVLLFRLWATRERVERETLRQRHLATLGEMSAVLAHEIKNPLAVAKGHAQLLSERAQDEKQVRWADRVVESLERLEALSADLLDLARSGEVHPELSSVSGLIERAAREVDSNRVQLDSEGAPKEWRFDPGHMHTVLVNLLRNALQASPEPDTVKLSAKLQAGSLVLCVTDRGPGIAPADFERIFEAFHTTRTRGAGLGLAIARRIVQLHGGSIRATNAPQGGASFEVVLPGA